MVAVEVNVEQRMRGFYLELWVSAPELFVVAVRSPGGTLMPAQNVPGNSHQEQEFIFEGTRVEIDYAQVGRTRGISWCLSGLKTRRQGSGRCMLIRVPRSQDNFISGCQ